MNVQSKIIEGIKSLLHQQDYVVLPGFGGFVTQIHFSKYLVEKNILTPPGKIISFNKQLRQNDGLLTSWLQSELNIDIENAGKHVADFSEYCQQVLKAKRRLSLENLGFFYLDFENNICFEPQHDSNYFLESFGLTPIVLNELAVEKEELKQDTIFTDKTPELIKQELPVKKKRNYKPLAYLALGGSILFLGLSLLVNLNKNQGPLLSGVFTSKNGTYKSISYSDITIKPSVSETNPYFANSSGIAVVSIGEKNFTVAVNSSNLAPETVKAHVSIKGKFQIVLGCFSMLDNAEKMIKKLKNHNINALISGTNAKGMHVVSCAGFESKEEAQNYLSEIKNTYPTAWIKSEN